MKNGYEYYYLFGLDIPLEEFGLGTIKQPKIKDFLSKDIAIENFYDSFIVIDYVVGTSKDKSLTTLKDKFGRFALFTYICEKTNKYSNIQDLINKINFLYGVDNATFDGTSIVIKGVIEDKENPGEFKDLVINNDNFDKLCDVVLEMNKINKSDIKFDNEEDLYKDLSSEMIEAKRKFLERNKKKKNKDDSLSMLDIANIVIHSKSIDYEIVENMTLYQLKNSFEVLNIKESFDVSTLYRISPKFDMSKEKYEHWTGKIKINKSRLAD